MSAALRWTIGLAASAGVHVAAGFGLLAVLTPEDVPTQPTPETEVEMVAHTLDRTEAQPAEPDVAAADEAEAKGAGLQGGAIPTSRASTATPEAESLSGTAPPAESAQAAEAEAEMLQADAASADPVAATEATAQSVPSATAPAATASQAVLEPETGQVVAAEAAPVATATPQTQAVAPAQSRAEVQTAANAQADRAAPVAAPTSQVEAAQVAAAALPQAQSESVQVTSAPAPVQVAALSTAVTEQATATQTDAQNVSALPPTATPAAVAAPSPAPAATIAPEPAVAGQSQPETAALPDTAPAPQPAAQGTPDRQAVGAADPEADSVKAALAFPGGDSSVDPVSFAAFQSFMQPGDLSSGQDPVRDGVSGILAQVPCSRLQVGFDPETTTLVVNGHLPDDSMRSDVLAALQSQMGADIGVSDNMLVLPSPQCNALSGIASVGLPQSTDQFTNPLVIGEDTHARVFGFVEGDYLSLDMTAPDYDAVIYLDYFDAEGNVLHLEPNEYVPLRAATAKTAQRIGARTAEDEGLKLIIGAPYGQEIAVAFAASHPLYEGVRPIQEPAEPYLAWLRERVEAARAEHADFKGEWVYFFVTTSAD
ncbi:MAG: hypothetical protein AB3N23_07515 [Paracoccaceae bacterium]